MQIANVDKGVEKRDTWTQLVKVSIGTATVENSIAVSSETKNRTPCDPGIPLLGIYLKKTKTLIQKGTCTPVFIAALFTIAKVNNMGTS